MADDSPKTDPQNPGATGDDGGTPPTPPATNPQGSGPATDDDETVTLKKSDYKNLQAQRDRANQQNRDSEEFLEELAAERAIKSFLKENKDKYPDVKYADIKHVTPANLEVEAARVQRRLEDHAQAKIMNIEKATAPVLSPQEKEARLKELKEKGGADAFEQMLDLRLPSNA